MPIKRVLVVDDSKAARLVLRKMLQEADLSVDLAESAEEALRYLEGQRPDAIFMDHTMPGMDGLQAVQAIKSNPKTLAIPVAMYTSMEGEHYLEQARAHGVVSVLPKPASAAALAQVLRQLDEAAETAQQTAASKVVRFKPGLPAAVQPPINGAWVEELVRQVARPLVADEVQARLGTLLDERLARMQEMLQASSQATLLELTNSFYESRLKALSHKLEQKLSAQVADLRANLTSADPIGPELMEELQILARDSARQQAETLAREVAGQVAVEAAAKVLESQLELLSIRLNQRLQEQLDALAEPRRLAPELLEEIRDMARLVAARQAQDVAREAAEKIARGTLRKMLDEERAGSDGWRRQWPAVLAGALGLGAALAVYLLR
ncbi:MAG TPA: response regulator [Candidatus Competibacteraceae bacterium]|nr:response regulator [Candidatus Competibacteraceae bacterium]